MLSVPDLGRAASQLRRAAVFAVVVIHGAVVHHGRNVREGSLETERKESSNISEKLKKSKFFHNDDGQTNI